MINIFEIFYYDSLAIFMNVIEVHTQRIEML